MFIHIVSWIYNTGWLYFHIDGKFFAWLSTASIKWSNPFDLLVTNPFQGIISLFLPYSSWWNPGALSLLLPFSELVNSVISYIVYFIEVFFSMYFLARSVKFSNIQSLFAAQILVFLCFPPFVLYYSAIPLLSFAPFFAHLTAVSNLILVLFISLGKGSYIKNIAIVFIIILCCFILFFSSFFYALLYVTIYIPICISLIFQNVNKHSFLWKNLTVFFIVFIVFYFDLINIYKNLSNYLTRSSIVAMPFIKLHIPTIAELNFNPCAIRFGGINLLSIFCHPKSIVSLFFVLSFFGGLISLFDNNQEKWFRWFACLFCLIAILPDFLGFVFINKIVSGQIASINPFYFSFIFQPFFVIFFVVFINYIYKSIIGNKFFLFIINGSYNSLKKILSYFIVMIIPVAAGYYHLIIKSTNTFKQFSTTPIIDYLHKSISINPGDEFRGSVLTYFSGATSALRQMYLSLDVNIKRRFQATPSDYVNIYTYLYFRGENPHMLSGLWRYNIPTIEEYAQMITKPMFEFFYNMLTTNGDFQKMAQLHVSKLDLKVLRALGTKFIITDQRLNNADLSLVLVHSIEKSKRFDINEVILISGIFNNLLNELSMRNNVINISEFKGKFKNKLSSYFNNETIEFILYNFNVSYSSKQEQFSVKDILSVKKVLNSYLKLNTNIPNLYLYEINNPNIATYSPVKPIKVFSKRQIFSIMKNTNFSFEKNIIVQEDIPYNLVPVKKSVMSFNKNYVKIRAESKGWSLLLLPLQYSNCLNIKFDNKYNTNVKLIRTNFIQSALLFHDKVDIDIYFSMDKGANCRRLDYTDYRKME